MALPKPGQKHNFGAALQREKTASSQNTQGMENFYSIFDESLDKAISKLAIRKGDQKKGYQFDYEEYTRISILPLQIRQGSPLVREGIIAGGSFWYYAPYSQHQVEYTNDQGVVGRIPVLCKSKTFGKPCLICEARNSQVQNLVKDGTSYRDAYKAVGMDLKSRAFFLLYVHNGPMAGKIVVYETFHTDGGSFSSLKKKITNSMNLFIHSEGISIDSIDIMLIEHSEDVIGLDFDLKLEMDSFGGNPFVQIGDINALKRRVPLPDLVVSATDEFGDIYAKLKLPNDESLKSFLDNGVIPKNGFSAATVVPEVVPEPVKAEKTAPPPSTEPAVPQSENHLDDDPDIPF